MSFSAKVKRELCNHENGVRHCDIAEIAGILNTCGHVAYADGKLSVAIQTENPAVAKKFFKLVKSTFQCTCHVSMKRVVQFKKNNRAYVLSVRDQEQAKKLLLATGLLEMGQDGPVVHKHLNPTVVKSPCCKSAYLRGAFMAGGSQCDPEKAYHLEFVNSQKPLAVSLMALLRFFELKANIIERKGMVVVYLKDGESIVDLLNIMSAHVALLDLENVRIMKDMRNQVNRRVNFETANLDKTVNASIKQIEDIRFIQDTQGLQRLPGQLRDMAHLRLQYPEASLKELGTLLSPPVGKSGVNHRLRKLSHIAEKIRRDHDDGENGSGSS